MTIHVLTPKGSGLRQLCSDFGATVIKDLHLPTQQRDFQGRVRSLLHAAEQGETQADRVMALRALEGPLRDAMSYTKMGTAITLDWREIESVLSGMRASSTLSTEERNAVGFLHTPVREFNMMRERKARAQAPSSTGAPSPYA